MKCRVDNYPFPELTVLTTARTVLLSVGVIKIDSTTFKLDTTSILIAVRHNSHT